MGQLEASDWSTMGEAMGTLAQGAWLELDEDSG